MGKERTGRRYVPCRVRMSVGVAALSCRSCLPGGARRGLYIRSTDDKAGPPAEPSAPPSPPPLPHYSAHARTTHRNAPPRRLGPRLPPHVHRRDTHRARPVRRKQRRDGRNRSTGCHAGRLPAHTPNPASPWCRAPSLPSPPWPRWAWRRRTVTGGRRLWRPPRRWLTGSGGGLRGSRRRRRGRTDTPRTGGRCGRRQQQLRVAVP